MEEFKYVFINADTGAMKVRDDMICDVNTGWIFRVPSTLRLDVSLAVFENVVYLFQLVMNHPESELMDTIDQCK